MAQTSQKKFFSVRTKLLLLLSFLAFFFIFATATSLFGLLRIGYYTDIIVGREAPFVRVIQGALFEMIQSQFAAERILDLETPEQLTQAAESKNTLERARSNFKMLIAAITWGSETEAFRKSEGGENYANWVDGGYAGKLVVRESPPLQGQHAGRINIYFDGYANNLGKAIVARESYITLLSERSAGAETARKTSKDYLAKARYFADLTTEHLHEMIRISNETSAESAEALRSTEESVRGISLIVSVIGFLVSIAVGLSFAEKIIVEPLLSLVRVAQNFGAGNFAERVKIASRDELGILGDTFNTTAQKLGEYTASLTAEVQKRTLELNEKLKELDISNSELSERETELRIANERLLEQDRVKSEFISVAAHQLRTPLSALKWIFGILLDEHAENLSAEQKSMLMKGYESNERMISLINEMLVVTRIESGKVRFDFAPIHIEDVIESVLQDFSVQAHVRKMQLSFDHPGERLPYIHADPEKVRNVLQNLIENAMRYTADGGTILISATRLEDAVQIAVSDTGIGIPEKQRSSIFNKFFRADNAMKQQTDGSGLGLFIAKSMVEKHGGKMRFESKEGKGTTFFFTVPLSTSPRQT